MVARTHITIVDIVENHNQVVQMRGMVGDVWELELKMKSNITNQ
jgi:hypothetical protein